MPDDINPSLEDQSTEQDAAAIEAEAPTAAPLEVPSKFKGEDGVLNEQALLQAYKDLESKQSTSDADPELSNTDEDSKDAPENATTEDLKIEAEDSGNKLDPFFQEYEADGQLSDESFTALEAMGISKEIAENYIGQATQIAEAETVALIQEVGGKEQFEQMQQWAITNKSADELDVFNKAVTGFDGAARQEAFLGLQGEWESANGIIKNTVAGAADVAYSSDPPFQSDSDMRIAMRDPRYKADPSYRAKVHAKTASMMGIDRNIAKGM